MAHFTILKAELKPGGMRSRIGWSKSLPKTRAEPGTVMCGTKVKAMEYWSWVWLGVEK